MKSAWTKIGVMFVVISLVPAPEGIMGVLFLVGSVLFVVGD